MTLITSNKCYVHMTLIVLRRSLVQRSMPASDIHRNLANANTAPESPKGYASELTQTLPTGMVHSVSG